MKRWWLASVVIAFGCAPKVSLEVPAHPAVHLPADAVAVIARDRGCQDVADALVGKIADETSLRVDPRADARLELFACGDDQQLTLEQVDALDTETQRRTTVAARAHAVVAVSWQGRTLAHLIGAGREHYASPWQDTTGLLELRNNARKQANDDLARDLARQIDPLPTLVERRVYPNAAEGTAKALTTRAVAAEQSGDLEQALELAEAAWARDPNPRTAGYLVELKRRVATR